MTPQNGCAPDREHKSTLSAVLQCDPNKMGNILSCTIPYFQRKTATYFCVQSHTFIQRKWAKMFLYNRIISFKENGQISFLYTTSYFHSSKYSQYIPHLPLCAYIYYILSTLSVCELKWTKEYLWCCCISR